MAGEKVLIVEDNALNMELAADLLELTGYEVIQAETAEEGIELAAGDNPALILMDIALPGMDGLTAIRRLKSDAGTHAIPIIALTAHAMKGDEERAMDAGCVGYITKPIDTRSFAATVSGYLEQSRAR